MHNSISKFAKDTINCKRTRMSKSYVKHMFKSSSNISKFANIIPEKGWNTRIEKLVKL